MKTIIALIVLFGVITFAAWDASTSAPAAPADKPDITDTGALPEGCREIAMVAIAAGGAPPEHGNCPEAAEFDGNPEQIAAGHQLYAAFNCVGCHFNGGGGMGPALMDDQWIYGSSMENVASSIVEGRPRGMPSFRALVTDDQVWQLAAYVRSMSDLAKKSKEAESSER